MLPLSIHVNLTYLSFLEHDLTFHDPPLVYNMSSDKEERVPLNVV